MIPEGVKRHIDSIAQWEQEWLGHRTAAARVGERIADIVGSPFFFVAHVLAMGGWIAVNSLDVFGGVRFDPFPFVLLALGIAAETLLLSTVVLMSQKSQTLRAHHWVHATLQVGLLVEQATTKLLQLLQSLGAELGVKKFARDAEWREMVREMPIVAVVQQLEKARDADEVASAPLSGEAARAA